MIGERVDDPHDPRLEVFHGLRDHALRQARERPGGDMAGSFIGEGDVVIGRALAAGHVLESILVDGTRTLPLPDIVPHDAPVFAGGPDVLRAVTGRPALRDPIACFVRPQPADVAALLGAARTVVVTEGVNNPTNMGVIARCAAGLGADALLVDTTSCDPLYRRAVRVSMGEVFALPHASVGSIGEALDVLHAAGYATLALTPAPDAADIGDLRFGRDDRVAIVLGAEGPGLTAATQQACTDRIAIPMAAGVDSINVGTAAAVACYAVRSARGAAGATE